jgi:hypothetical protein
MNSSEIVELFRQTVSDEAVPYLWSDAEAYRYLDDAQKMFCRLTGGLGDGSTTVTQLSYTDASDWVTLSPLILKIRAATDNATGRHIDVLNFEDMRADDRAFSATKAGTVRAVVIGIEPGRARLSPYPRVAGQINLIVDRLPLKSITDADQKLEIAEQHHQHLITWMLYRAYSKQDAETLNRKAAQDAELAFNQYCFDAEAEKARAMHKTRTVRYGGI